MDEGRVLNIIDFLSKDCKYREHGQCCGNWSGLGLEVKCNCSCHIQNPYQQNKVLKVYQINRNNLDKTDENGNELLKKGKLEILKNRNYLSTQGSEAQIDRNSRKENPNDARY